MLKNPRRRLGNRVVTGNPRRYRETVVGRDNPDGCVRSFGRTSAYAPERPPRTPRPILSFRAAESFFRVCAPYSARSAPFCSYSTMYHPNSQFLTTSERSIARTAERRVSSCVRRHSSTSRSKSNPPLIPPPPFVSDDPQPSLHSPPPAAPVPAAASHTATSLSAHNSRPRSSARSRIASFAGIPGSPVLWALMASLQMCPRSAEWTRKS